MKNPRASFYGLMGGLLIGAALTLFTAKAHAVINFAGTNYLVATPSGGGLSQTIRFSEPPTLQYGLPSAKAATIQQSMSLPINGGKVPLTVPITSKQVIPKAKVAAAVGKLAKGLIPGVMVGAALLDALELAGYQCDLTGCRTKAITGGATKPAISVAGQVPAVTYSCGGYTPVIANRYTMCDQLSAGAVGSRAFQNVNGGYYGYGQCVFLPNGSVTCDVQAASCPAGSTYAGNKCMGTIYSCESGWTLSGTTCTQGAAPSVSATDDEVIDHLPDSAIQPALEQILQDPNQNTITPDAPQLSGPASVTSPNSTTTIFNSATSTTTVTTNSTTVTNNYAGNAYNYTITNNSSTTVNGVPSGTTSEQVAPKPEDTAVVNDTANPPIPKLYTRKFPDGIEGVWNTRSLEIKATPLFGLSAIFNPSIGGGSCPVWTFDANIGPHMNFGTGVISPPCWIWPMIKAVLIITALLISRRLVFGG